MLERPTEPGLWHREGKNYRVFESSMDGYRTWADEIKADGSLAGHYVPVDSLPTGNWQPLVAPVTLSEAKKELHEWISLNMLGSGYDRLVNKAAELFAGVPQEPEVIEGKGQAVTEGQQGRYVFQRADRQSSVETVLKLAGSLFEKGFRYMRCPTFPPRPTFTPPPKPEHLIRRKSDNGGDGFSFWADKRAGGYLAGNMLYSFEEHEVIDEQTGEVIQ